MWSKSMFLHFCPPMQRKRSLNLFSIKLVPRVRLFGMVYSYCWHLSYTYMPHYSCYFVVLFFFGLRFRSSTFSRWSTALSLASIAVIMTTNLRIEHFGFRGNGGLVIR